MSSRITIDTVKQKEREIFLQLEEEGRIARERARRAEEERVALERKELEIAAEMERLRKRTPQDIMLDMLNEFQTSFIKKFDHLEQTMNALCKRIEKVERMQPRNEILEQVERRVEILEKMDNGLVSIAGLPKGCPVNINTISISMCRNSYSVPSCELQLEEAGMQHAFHVVNHNPWSLSGFQRFKHCTTLHLCIDNTIKDFTPIGEMIQLRVLTIRGIDAGANNGSYSSHTGLSDIRWILTLQNLTNVSFIACNALHDITPLRTLRNLKEVTLHQTGVHSTECIAGIRVSKT